ncbi:MAG: PorV/PorQ family protein [Ignavibacteriaceae bacterium]
MISKRVHFLSLSIILFAFQIHAQTTIAKYAGEFLAIGVGGRALGMGGAYVAAANDVTAGYYNPAGLININYPEISLMHEERFGSLVNYDYAAVAIPYGTDMSLGLSVIRLAVDGIPDTRNALVDANGDGTLNILNDRLDYSKITEFSNQDWAIYLSFAKKMSDEFSYGASVKIIRETLAEYGATGIGFDVGAQYRPMDNLMLGANIQDVTTTLVAWSTGRNELISPTVKVGGAYKFEFLGGTFMPAVDIDVRFEDRQYAANFYIGPISFDRHVGIEYNFKNIFMIRGGYNDVNQFTIGAGVKLPKLNIDYSFARFNGSADENLPDTHRISLILTLEQPKFLRDGL